VELCTEFSFELWGPFLWLVRVRFSLARDTSCLNLTIAMHRSFIAYQNALFHWTLFVLLFAFLLNGARLPSGYRQVQDKLLSSDIWEKDDHTIYFPLPLKESSRLWKEYRIQRINSHTHSEWWSKSYWEPNDQYMKFIPQYKATLFPDGRIRAWNAACFQNTTATFNASMAGGKIIFNLQNRTSLTCNDVYLILDRINWYFKIFVSPGRHVLEFASWKEGEYKVIVNYGLQVFILPDGILGSIQDLIYTLKLFLGTDVVEHNIEVLQDYWNYTFVERKLPNVILDPSFIESGDYFAIRTLDGIDTLIMLGTGSHSAHTAIAHWIDGQLYVCESTGEPSDWPPPYGIVKTPYQTWIQRAAQTNREVSLLKLSPSARSRYNATAAMEWFRKVEGLPFGYQNFIFGWIDTIKDNYPPPMNAEIILYVVILMQYIDFDSCNNIILLGLNKRLGTEKLGIYEILDVLRAKKLTFEELLTISEQDSWQYPTGPSLVCDVFVMSMYKAGGLLEPYTKQIQVTEFTPRDSYQMNFFLLSKSQRPPPCQVDDLPYCQLLGKYRMDLKEAGTIKPYPYMFERCGALPPNYERRPLQC